MEIRVALDIDGVLADFGSHFLDYLGIEDKTPALSWDDVRFRDNMHKVGDDAKFWLGIPPLVKPEELGFTPVAYVTARDIETQITQAWLKLNGFPEAHVETVRLGGSKVEFLQSIRPDYYIDDAVHNFISLNAAGVRTLLMTRSHNEYYDAGDNRIASFDEFRENYLMSMINGF